MAECLEVIQNLERFLGSNFDQVTHHMDGLSQHRVFSRDGVGRSTVQVKQRYQVPLDLVESL